MDSEYIEISEKTGVFPVVGCDTFYRARMRKHLCEAGKAVYGFGQAEEFDQAMALRSQRYCSGRC